MIARSRRLPLRKEMPKEGHSFSSPYFLLKFSKNNLAYNRYAVVISAKAGKTSVYRHAVKRTILRIASAWDNKEKSTGRDFLFIVSSRLATVSRASRVKELAGELSRAYSAIARYTY